MTAAATIADARAQWPDAETIEDDTLTTALDASWETCAAFLPVEVVDPDPGPYVPTPAHVSANVLAARDLWTAYRRDGDVIGFDTYAVRVRPLSDTVKALLRPPRGRPSVG
jgi:hypothetical protein